MRFPHFKDAVSARKSRALSELLRQTNIEDRKQDLMVTVDEVERVASLAHLKLSADETAGLQHDLNAILEYVAELNGLDTTGVPPLTQVTELIAPGSSGLRQDEVRPSLDRAAVMAEAPETDQAFFKVPRVIER